MPRILNVRPLLFGQCQALFQLFGNIQQMLAYWHNSQAMVRKLGESGRNLLPLRSGSITINWCNYCSNGWFMNNKLIYWITHSKEYSSSSGKPLEGATVTITGGAYEYPDTVSQSDAEGVFFLPEIKIPAMYYLLIQHGDQSKTIEVHLNRDSEIHVRL